MRRFRAVLAGFLAAGALISLHTAANAQAIITNGTVRLGVRLFGDLNQPGAPASITGQTIAGVRFIKPGVGELEYTSDGCTCEGWGVSGSGTGAWANSAATQDPTAVGNLSSVSFSSTATTATVVTDATNGLRITHDYSPSASSFLYHALVTVTNTSAATVTDVKYRRTMDWDVTPTQFNESTKIQGWPAAPIPGQKLSGSSNDGFASSNPLNPITGAFNPMGAPINANYDWNSFRDQGANFDFSFGDLDPGKSVSFDIFYGGAPTEAAALAAVGAVGGEVYSFGKPNIPETDNRFSVSIFAFGKLGLPPVGVPEPGTWAMLGGSLIGLGVLRFRRKK